MKRILISGAGVAGPSLAFWLCRFGFQVTLVERAAALREGGQAVDFRGPVHRAVLDRMGLWGAIEARRTKPQAMAFVDADSKPYVRLPEVMMAGDLEILRGDLCRLLYERTAHQVDYRFGDRIATLLEDGAGVNVDFERAPRERFDLVIGADGLHSGVRALAFAPDAACLRHQGYRIASFAAPGLINASGLSEVYTVPERAVCVGGERVLMVYRGGAFERESRAPEAQKPALFERFRGLGWRVPRVLEALENASDLYVDAVATVHVDHYSRGRIALLGDAAYGGTLGGQGTSLAMVGAYVLAHELARAENPEHAFARYEALMRPYAEGCQKGAHHVGPFFAPSSRMGLMVRNAMYWLLTSRPLSGFFERLVKSTASDFSLPDYATA